MSIMSRMISRLSAITIHTGALPLFSWSLARSPPSPPSNTPSNITTPPLPSSHSSSNTPPPAPPQTSQEVPYPTALEQLDTQKQDLRRFVGDQFRRGNVGEGGKRKRVLWMGEHHEQPRVLAAQLVILDELVNVARGPRRKGGDGSNGKEEKEAVQSATGEVAEGSGKEMKQDIVLVMEQFNFRQQGMLDQFCGWPTPSSSPVTSLQRTTSDEDHTPTSTTTSTPSHTNNPKTSHEQEEEQTEEQAAATTLLSSYTTSAAEGFDLTHYMPLLLYARSQHIRIIGGFPPRAWARIIAREGVETLRGHHGEELAELGFENWEGLKVSEGHAAWVRSLMRGEAPVVEGVGGESEESREKRAGKKGVLAAQAFKDAVLGFVVDRELEGGSGVERGSDVERGDVVKPIVMVVTGCGHCEYDFGAPKRVKLCTRDEMCVVVCRSRDESAVWQGERWGQDAERDDRRVADGIIVYEQV